MEKKCQYNKTVLCSHDVCSSCVWDPKEAARRKKIIRDGGLQVGEDGLRRLYIKKEEEIADDAD